jgi:hypothetical protein
MVLLALVSLAFGAEATRRRAIFYREKAAYHALEEVRKRSSDDWYRDTETFWASSIESARSARVSDKEAQVHLRETRSIRLEENTLADYHGMMRRKYERAATEPWWSVPPDPPAPPFRFDYDQEEWDQLRTDFKWLPDTPPRR